jgi:signal transduction histidine kinase
VGTENGLSILTFGSQQRPTYSSVPSMRERVFGIQEDAQGNIWLETLTAGLFRLTPSSTDVESFGLREGLPTLLYNHTAATSQGLLAFNEKGIYRFAPGRNRFVPHNPFGGEKPATAFWKNELVEDARGNIWTVEGDKKRVTLYRKQAGSYVPVTTPLLPISTSPINVIYPDEQNLVWFGGRDGVVRYNPAVRKQYDLAYPALIRQVHTVGDKVLYDGTGSPQAAALPYNRNDISFDFAAVNFPVTQDMQFQYILENYDKTWSDWTAETKKGYTNLPAGKYRFRVKARNIYEVLSREATYDFTVTPPWYARWWMIALFVAAGAALLYLVVRWRLNALVREKQALENLIRERTEEVVIQKEELEKQSEELAVKNDQLEKIDLIVQSINAEIDFTNLFQTVLAKFSVIRNMNSASFLVFEPANSTYRFKALRSNRDLSYVEDVALTQEQAERRFLANATEVFEDVYLKNDVQYEPLHNAIDELVTPKSLITIVIETEGHIDGFITLENTTRSNAFDQRDISMICNLREHLIAAFIKTRLLENLENTLNDLNNAQDELIRQEKLASVGQLTKGIVDRILNPLNYVSNFSQSSDSLIDEAVETLEKQRDALPADMLDDLLDELSVLKVNSQKIQEHSKSTARILMDMQKLLREKSRDFLETDFNLFLESRLRMATLEAQAGYPGWSANLVTDLTQQPLPVRLLPHEFGQVVQNLISNAWYTLHEKHKALGSSFVPEIRVSTALVEGQVQLRFHDNGKGIPSREIERIFSPFFTTKPTSKGTGLGLFMTKDIVETHRGKIDIVSQEGEFTELLISLPLASK